MGVARCLFRKQFGEAEKSLPSSNSRTRSPVKVVFKTAGLFSIEILFSENLTGCFLMVFESTILFFQIELFREHGVQHNAF